MTSLRGQRAAATEAGADAGADAEPQVIEDLDVTGDDADAVSGGLEPIVIIKTSDSSSAN